MDKRRKKNSRSEVIYRPFHLYRYKRTPKDGNARGRGYNITGKCGSLGARTHHPHSINTLPQPQAFSHGRQHPIAASIGRFTVQRTKPENQCLKVFATGANYLHTTHYRPSIVKQRPLRNDHCIIIASNVRLYWMTRHLNLEFALEQC